MRPGGWALKGVSFAAGQVLGDQFVLVRCAGRGGAGEVWQAERQSTGQTVAIKLLHSDDDPHGVLAQRFQREARAISALKHPNTVRLYGFGAQQDGQLYMVLEFIEGETLKQCLRQRNAIGRVLPQSEARRIGIEVLRSLGEAHQAGVVHRDVKPANIMMQTNDDELPAVRLVDFGVAHVAKSQLTGAGMAVGTPGYMSPQQWLGEPSDGRSDLYSLGIVLYECVTGDLPFRGSPYQQLQQHIHATPAPLAGAAKTEVQAGFCEVVERALAKDPAERFPTALAMRKALQALG